jgi:hypothetical protein
MGRIWIHGVSKVKELRAPWSLESQMASLAFKVTNRSVQFRQSPASSNPFVEWLLRSEKAEPAQQPAFMYSSATWPPGAIQSTEGELGNSRNTNAAITTQLLPELIANFLKPLFMELPCSQMIGSILLTGKKKRIRFPRDRRSNSQRLEVCSSLI